MSVEDIGAAWDEHLAFVGGLPPLSRVLAADALLALTAGHTADAGALRREALVELVDAIGYGGAAAAVGVTERSVRRHVPPAGKRHPAP